MAIGTGEGAEVWAPLGRVVVGGLFVSMLFTLFFIPSLYSVIEGFRERRYARPVLEREAEAAEAGVAD
jgi:HAE1 family hydrophobic/amphiphilic exporter-1